MSATTRRQFVAASAAGAAGVATAALAFHGWLTEAVETVTSACDARGRRFQTPIGGFSFDRVECVDF